MKQRKTKKCPNCEKRKKLKQFPANKGRSDGRGPWCRTCMSGAHRSWYERNREHHNKLTMDARRKRVAAGCTKPRDYARQYRADRHGQIRFELSTRRADAVKRAKRKDIDITITLDQLEELWKEQKGRCALTGWKMKVRGGGLTDPYCLTIDRIKDEDGYVPGNVRLVCWMANKAKSAWGERLFVKMCKDVLKRRG